MKKIVLLTIVLALSGNLLFAQSDDAGSDKSANSSSNNSGKHKFMDMYVGINIGYGMMITGDVLNLRKGYFIVTAEEGVTYDFYITSWLSVSTGFFAHEHVSFYLPEDASQSSNIKLGNILRAPFCLTIPIQAHINIPYVSWLYMGAGAAINIPLFSFISGGIDSQTNETLNTKGDVFVGVPIDFGFDFTRPNRGGMRLFFRVTPTFTQETVMMPVGIVFQAWNFKVH
ncbi:hypothetical protein FACS189494_06700 [Spirochaetia bacterium]|nr:hypothetical protein FACS189494_06700 [Spirochaetia bacterium]